MPAVSVDLPEWVIVEDSILSSTFGIGRVKSTWRNNVQVEFMSSDGQMHIGNYTARLHAFREPTLTEWIERAELFGDMYCPTGFKPGTMVVFRRDYAFNYPLCGSVKAGGSGWVVRTDPSAASDEASVFVFLVDEAEELEEWANVLHLTEREASEYLMEVVDDGSLLNTTDFLLDRLISAYCNDSGIEFDGGAMSILFSGFNEYTGTAAVQVIEEGKKLNLLI